MIPTFEVYTYFGRVLKVFEGRTNKTHHDAYEQARIFIVDYEKQNNSKAWVRIRGLAQ
jgi:hypothetical protein